MSLEVKVYTDEETAVKDYEAKQCDAVVLQAYGWLGSSIFRRRLKPLVLTDLSTVEEYGQNFGNFQWCGEDDE